MKWADCLCRDLLGAGTVIIGSHMPKEVMRAEITKSPVAQLTTDNVVHRRVMTDMPSTHRTIVVGLVENDAGALTYADESAAMTKSDVKVVHSVDLLRRADPAQLGLDRATLVDAAQSRLDGARAMAGEMAAGSAVDFVLRRGSISRVLTEESASAGEIVIGTVQGPEARGVALFRGLVQYALCPVVLVPEGWAPSLDGRVLAAFDSSTVADGPLEYAFDVATAQDRTLDIRYMGSSTAGADDAPWNDLLGMIALWRARYPHIDVTGPDLLGEGHHDYVRTDSGTTLMVVGRSADLTASVLPGWMVTPGEHTSVNCALAVVAPDFVTRH
jgi:hypothetical protein